MKIVQNKLKEQIVLSKLKEKLGKLKAIKNHSAFQSLSALIQKLRIIIRK